MADQVALQADVGNVPTNALALLGAAQPLLKALSADNINALAVLQAQALGDMFLSNGEWASRLPDLLARTSSVRMERLSAWIGWQKGDTASYMSRSSGGRTISLICLALGNLYTKERCGMILHRLSSQLIAGDQQNASISQLSDLNECLSGKLSCLGFGNLLGHHLTRLRQCFFEAGLVVPTDLADMPTEETMEEFLVELQRALKNEGLVLSFSGTKGAGPLIALAMCLCPEDTLVDVEGELIHQSQRSSVIFSVTGYEQHNGSRFWIESSISTHSEDFSHRYVKIVDSNEPYSLKFKWTGWLSSCLDIAIAKVGAGSNGNVPEALANLIASAVYSLSGDELCNVPIYKRAGNYRRLPKNGMRTLLGPEYNFRVRKTLRTVLVQPTDLDCMNIASCYLQLQSAVNLVIPKTNCSCNLCFNIEHLNVQHRIESDTIAANSWRSCRVARFWTALCDILDVGYISSLIEVKGDVAIGYAQQSISVSPEYAGRISKVIALIFQLSKGDHILPEQYVYGNVDFVHTNIMLMLKEWSSRRFYVEEEFFPPIICRSSGHATIFPAGIQHPCVIYPWSVEYLLVDGKLHEGPNSYSAIVCAGAQIRINGSLERPKFGGSLSPKNTKIIPSSLGEHDIFSMTLQPEIYRRTQVLILRSRIQSSAKIRLVDFLDIYLGFLTLTPADECDHNRLSPLDSDFSDGVVTTPVEAPVAAGGKHIALTLTHWNPEAQFLCCSMSARPLYQGSCCLTCAVIQARREKYTVVIGGNG